MGLLPLQNLVPTSLTEPEGREPDADRLPPQPVSADSADMDSDSADMDSVSADLDPVLADSAELADINHLQVWAVIFINSFISSCGVQ